MFPLYFFAFVELGLLVKYYSAIGFRKIPLQYIGNPCAIIGCYAQNNSHFYCYLASKCLNIPMFFFRKFHSGSFKCAMQPIGFDLYSEKKEGKKYKFLATITGCMLGLHLN